MKYWEMVKERTEEVLQKIQEDSLPVDTQQNEQEEDE